MAGPEFVFERPREIAPRVSLVLLDWCCRESFHIFEYLEQQDVPRDLFEVLWIEYYDRTPDAIRERLDRAHARGATPPLDRWIVMNMPRTAYYHKHLMYNVGIVASRGDIIMIGDSDAMVRPTFVRSIIDAFDADPRIALHHDEVRNVNRAFYPFNYPSFDQVEGAGTINWKEGATTGLAPDCRDRLHTLNYGACLSARREDLISIGGADEHIDYLGHICGPYEMTWRLVNAGRREFWHPSEFLYHVWHPGTDGDENYLGPHDGRNVSSTALAVRRTGRVLPLVENPAIAQLRTGQLGAGAEHDLVRLAIGGRDLGTWAFDRSKRLISAGRAAFSAGRYAEAAASWDQLTPEDPKDSGWYADAGWNAYFLERRDEARAAFDTALRADPASPSALRGRGWLRTRTGDLSGAIDDFSQALAHISDREDTYADALRGRGWARLHQNQFEEALADFRLAVQSCAEDDAGALQDAWRGIGWAELRAERPGPARRAFEQAMAHVADGDSDARADALRGLEQARARSERGADASARGAFHGDDRAGEVSLRARLPTQLGWAYYYKRAYGSALQCFAEALDVEQSPRALSGKGWTLLHLGRHTEALRAFDELAPLLQTADHGARHEFLRGRGWARYYAGDYPGAVTDFTDAMRLTEEPHVRDEILTGRSRAYFRLRQWRRVRDDVRDRPFGRRGLVAVAIATYGASIQRRLRRA